MTDNQTTTIGGSPFNPTVFVIPGAEMDAGDWAHADRMRFVEVRKLYPELAHFRDLALGCAIGDFACDYYMVGSPHEFMYSERDENFLHYCWWRQTRGLWDGDCSDDERLSGANEWRAGYHESARKSD
ncbi:hypothetical protein [Asaia sp. SF2.1]|uniref:hypothetical protein n=1 Tax=Asaia sp. SF2.1 TaxID=406101 RepID=UPI0003D2A94F|nr:hypothetical protein [Asaia sp. SF2.1]ETC99537.1 hypothetical protein P792_03645 [Asaia sp. SF2.1]